MSVVDQTFQPVNLAELCVVINLDDRPDRLESFQRSVLKNTSERKHPLPDLITPVLRLAGSTGELPRFQNCTRSHIRALRLLKEKLKTPLSWGLIFEDDAERQRGHVDVASYQAVELALKHSDVRVIMLGMNASVRDQSLETWSETGYTGLQKVRSAYCGTAYLVRRDYCGAVIECFERGHKRQMQLDVAWLALQAQDLWLGLKPGWFTQRSGWSDNEQRHVSYHHVMA